MLLRTLSSFAIVSIFTLSSVAAVEWPGFRGPNHDGAVPAKLGADGELGLGIGWKVPIGPGYSALAIGDDQVLAMFAAGEADVLAAFDVDSGKERWRYRIADTYAGHDGSHDGPISTPVIDGNRIVGLGAFGHLFAVDAATGKEIWTRHLVDDFGARKPHYGFTTAPLAVEGVLVVQMGVPEAEEGEAPVEGKALIGLDAASGELLWTLGEDTIEYHSPIVAEIAGRRQVVAAGQKMIYGVDAASGEVLWSHEHAGDTRAMGGMTIVPLPAGKNRLYIMNKIDASTMLQISKGDAGYEVAELWSNNSIKQSYVTPVYKDGYIYGMSNRIFTCIDAATGEIAWRSRQPGDGFPTLVGDKLVIVTKPGSLHVAEASPDGYREVAQLDLFTDHSWSEVAFADGSLFARSMAELARVDIVADADGAAERAMLLEGTEFGRFLTELDAADDKQAAIDAFIDSQWSFPIVEDDGSVHFVYRGEATDVGIVGDMIGFRREDPMVRVKGTDLFFYSTRLEPDAAVSYGFIPDYGDPVPDPLNDRPGAGLFGEVSWFAMPAWQAPDYLGEAARDAQGSTEEFAWESAAQEGAARKATIYLPAGYGEEITRSYPSVYVHGGGNALDPGQWKNSLDHLIARGTIEPLIAVFIHGDEENPQNDRGPAYGTMIVDELVPAIDERYRAVRDRASRASVGSGRSANNALMVGLSNTATFGRLAAQSATVGRQQVLPMLEAEGAQPILSLYLDWGTYHLRSPHEAWDLAEENRLLWQALREAGHRPAGGELPEGYGWGSWSGHTDELLAALFPKRR